MAKMTRRKLLVTTSTSAVAVGGVAALLHYQTPKASVSSATSTDVTSTTLATAGKNGPIAAYVSDATKSEVSVMVGEREIIVHDPVLVMHLLNIVP